MSPSSPAPTAATPAAQAPFTAERWQQFWKAWKAQPQQLEGIELLRQAVISADPAILTEAAPWRQTFSSAPPAPEPSSHANPLAVAWENQNDNTSGTGYRECFSSSCAMLARYWGKVGSDDEYNAIRAKYGDSTSAEALTWTPETEPALMRASLPARIGQEKPHESQTPQPRADHPQVANR